MGKIVKNGVTYSGSSDNADNVKYNNNVSNLDATNVQEAIDKLDESVDTLNSNLDKTNQSLDDKANIVIDTIDDGRKVIHILDNNGQHGINIILSTEYIRFDYILDGLAHTIMKYYVNGTSS